MADPTDPQQDVRRGIPIEFSKGEFGKGQHEINITYADALETADYHAIYKHGARRSPR